MNSRERAALRAVVEPRLGRDDAILATATAWVAERRPSVPLLFQARRRHHLALTERRLLLYARPRRRRPVDTRAVLDADLGDLRLTAQRSWGVLMQLRLASVDGAQWVIELRPGDRALGRRLARALRQVRA